MAENVIVLIPKRESAAFEALSRLRNTGFASGTLYGAAVVRTDADGKFELLDTVEPDTGGGAVTGSVVGALVGLLGGPIGVLLGAGAGALIGGSTDSGREVLGFRALPVIAAKLPPETTVLLAVADEESEAAFDALGEEFSAMVVRQRAADVYQEVIELQDAQDEAEYQRRARERADDRIGFQAKAEAAWADFKAKFRKQD